MKVIELDGDAFQKLHARITGVTISHMYLAITGNRVRCLEEAEHRQEEALKMFHNDAVFHARVRNTVADIFNEIFPKSENKNIPTFPT